jgi:hypothetical protein
MRKYELIWKLLPLWLALFVGSYSAIVALAWLINLGFIAFDVCLSFAMTIGAVALGCGIEMCLLILARRDEPSYTYPSIVGSLYVLPVILGLSGRFVTSAGVFSIVIYAGLLIRTAWLIYDIQQRQSWRAGK